MRIDKYLKVSRLIKRRTVASEACQKGKVLVNGKIVKASYDIKIGDEIEIQIGKTSLKVIVTSIKEDAEKLYKIC